MSFHTSSMILDGVGVWRRLWRRWGDQGMEMEEEEVDEDEDGDEEEGEEEEQREESCCFGAVAVGATLAKTT